MKKHVTELFILFLVLVSGVIDVALITYGKTSISEHTWNLNQQTHALVLFGLLLFLLASYLCRAFFWAPFVLGLIAGHLFWNF